MNDSKSLTEYSNDMNDIHKIIEESNPNEKRKILSAVVGVASFSLEDKPLEFHGTILSVLPRLFKV